MVDLSTTYLGIPLKNPVVASASPLSKHIDTVRRLEDAGVGAVVMYSLFEEQIVHDSMALNYTLETTTDRFSEAASYFPDMEKYNVGPENYLELIQKIKKSVRLPVIGSLNGVSTGGWVNYAKRIQEAGADALELNIYNIPTDVNVSAGELEDTYVELVAELRKHIHIPLAVKLSPYFTALPHFAKRLVDAGANGLVLFNRFYQPDLDIETLEVVPDLALSSSQDLRLPLRWIAILYGRIEADLALTSGVHTAQDVIKAMMAGAKVAMTASALIEKGPEYVTELLASMTEWMEKYEYDSIVQMCGSMSQKAVADPSAFERANYMKALTSFDHRIA
jgi:dihydroorotate dehydrogenase (fumarate)